VLFRYNRSNGGTVEPAPDAQPTVILGVHTCDLHGIQLLDQVFMTGYPDRTTPVAERTPDHRRGMPEPL
jgi:hypothetical protein